MNNIWEICKETGKKFNSARGFLNHLRTLKITSKEYYDKHHRQSDEGFCYCGNETKYHGFSYSKYCSNKCCMKSEETRKAISERFINNPEALESFRKSRIGVNNNIEKRKQTIENKCKTLGISLEEYYSTHSKKAYKSMTNVQIKKRTLKRMETIENSTGNFGGRSGYKSYNFFDEIVSLQGYEPIVLDYMINSMNLTKQQIKVGKSNVPIINYSEGDKQRMYFPDFYLPESNLLVEVKSKYTYNLHKENVKNKCIAALNSGYSILVFVLNKHEARNGKLDGSKNLLDWAISSQAPKPTWYGEGSTTILNGVESNDSKRSPTIYG
jgi:hypothetical protein